MQRIRLGEAGVLQGAGLWLGSRVTGRRVLAGALFVVLTTFGAYAAVPLPWTPVPMTLQPLFVLLSGLVLGPSTAAASMTAYVLLGVGGAPVFAAIPAGPAALVGPTGGFLLAFPLAAGLAGWVAGSDGAAQAGRIVHFMRLSAASVAGLLVIYLVGAAQFAVVTGSSLSAAYAASVLPFVAGDGVEVLAALALATLLKSRLPGGL